MEEHVNDPWVKKAQVDGYRSRASYKLLELIDKDKLVRPGMVVLDLGSTPGGWSQVVAPLLGSKGRLIASDILPMDPIPQVDFILGDFTEQEVFDQISATLNGAAVDLVMSDMAPNISGVDAADQASSMYLVELALDMAVQVLKPGGNFVTKVFHGEGYEEYLKVLRTHFDKVVVRKPEASRSRSREVYVLGKGRRHA
jgi:23S rRNA (uridine2552-2'-O)-methyltransferase